MWSARARVQKLTQAGRFCARREDGASRKHWHGQCGAGEPEQPFAQDLGGSNWKLAVVAERGKAQADPGGGEPGRRRCVWSSEAGSGG